MTVSQSGRSRNLRIPIGPVPIAVCLYLRDVEGLILTTTDRILSVEVTDAKLKGGQTRGPYTAQSLEHSTP
jgi:hypothetical protein